LHITLFDLLSSRLSCIGVNGLGNVSALQLPTQLKKCGAPLLVPFLQSGVIWVITCHSRRLTLSRNGNGLRTAFDTADKVVDIMSRTISKPIVGQSNGAMKNAATRVSDGYPIDNENTAFLFGVGYRLMIVE
jgi:hypothetical protein